MTLSPPRGAAGRQPAGYPSDLHRSGCHRATGDPWPPWAPPKANGLATATLERERPSPYPSSRSPGPSVLSGHAPARNFGRFQRLIPGQRSWSGRFAPLAAGEYWLQATLALSPVRAGGPAGARLPFHLTVEPLHRALIPSKAQRPAELRPVSPSACRCRAARLTPALAHVDPAPAARGGLQLRQGHGSMALLALPQAGYTVSKRRRGVQIHGDVRVDAEGAPAHPWPIISSTRSAGIIRALA